MLLLKRTESRRDNHCKFISSSLSGKSQLLRFASLKKMKRVCDMINRMAHNTIANLIPGDRNIIQEGKVYRRWISQSPPNPAATKYYCILLYREGNAVKENMPTILNISSRCLSMDHLRAHVRSTGRKKQKKVTCPHSGSIIELTLWDKMARNFDKDALELLEKPVIMRETYTLNPSLQVSKYQNEDKEQDKLRKRFYLPVLLEQNLESYK
nr:hypothetical protein [Tanacetum cinerariifolium]